MLLFLPQIMEELTAIHIRIRSLREARNISQDQIAERLGISPRSYARLESNDVDLTVERLIRIAEIMDIKPIEILDPDQDPRSVLRDMVVLQKEFMNQVVFPSKKREDLLKKLEILLDILNSQIQVLG
ncbi:MAG: helix-turn-helix domain-containing protein [Flavobacteriales bacterium]